MARDGAGISALFDSILFFIIVASACGALFYSISNASNATTEDIATRDLGQQAADIQACALESTIGGARYSVNGTNLTFNGTVQDCIYTMLEVQSFSSDHDIPGLKDAVRNAYALLVDKPFHFAVEAGITGWQGTIFLSDIALDPGMIAKVRWTSNVPLVIGGSEGELTLFLWR